MTTPPDAPTPSYADQMDGCYEYYTEGIAVPYGMAAGIATKADAAIQSRDETIASLEHERDSLQGLADHRARCIESLRADVARLTEERDEARAIGKKHLRKALAQRDELNAELLAESERIVELEEALKAINLDLLSGYPLDAHQRISDVLYGKPDAETEDPQ